MSERRAKAKSARAPPELENNQDQNGQGPFRTFAAQFNH
jgi:hypothetical protein